LINQAKNLEEEHKKTNAAQRSGDKPNDDSKHKLFESINDETKFYIVRLPNQECLNWALFKNIVPLITDEEIPAKSILFVTL